MRFLLTKPSYSAWNVQSFIEQRAAILLSNPSPGGDERLAWRLLADPMNTWLAAVRNLTERWRREGCAAFDQANTPLEVAEAAKQLRCALELSQLLDSQRTPRRERISATLRENAAEQSEIRAVRDRP